MTEEAMQGTGLPSNSNDDGTDDGAGQAIRRAFAIARWREAENKVYPLVMFDSALYESALTAIGLMSRRICTSCSSPEEILGVDEEALAVDFAQDAAIAAAIRASGLSTRLLCEAALAQAVTVLPS